MTPHRIYTMTRSVTAVDSAQASTTIDLDFSGSLTVFWQYVIAGSPTSVNVRCGVATAPDSSSATTAVPHQIIRFPDQTSTSGDTRIARLRCCTGSETEADTTNVDLTVAAATATVTEGPVSNTLRVFTYVPTLSGGSSPSVTINVWIIVE